MLLKKSEAPLPKISIIIPVYNVELYLRQCIQSVIEQSYTNIEVILVNDGSPDNCGAICDEYANKDNRLTVIHKKNEGVSGARNIGLDIATGEFIYFIDSDDWLDPDTIEVSYKNLINNNADISCCTYYIAYVNSTITPYNNGTTLLLSRQEAVKEALANQKIKTFLCGKLYKRHLFNNLRCPIDMIYCEDSFIIIKIFSQAEKIVLHTTPKYYYRQRKSSVVYGTYTVKYFNDGIAAASHNHKLVAELFPTLSELSKYNLILAYIALLKKMICTKKFLKLKEYKEAILTVRENYTLVSKSIYASKIDKLSALLIKTNIFLFKFAHNAYKIWGNLSNKILFE